MSPQPQLAETADQSIVIRKNRWKLSLMILVSLAFVLVGLWMMNSHQSSMVFYEGLAILIFFGLGFLFFLFQMVTSTLLLKIDDEGIHSFYPFWRPHTIRWGEIASIYPFKIHFTTILTVTVSPAGRPTYLARNFKAGKVPFNLRRADVPATAISLPLTTATLSAPKAIALMRERYADQIRRYRIYVRA